MSRKISKYAAKGAGHLYPKLLREWETAVKEGRDSQAERLSIEYGRRTLGDQFIQVRKQMGLPYEVSPE